MHRMARVVDWPARIAVSLGGGALLTLYLEFAHPRTRAGTRWFDDVRAGAVAALLFGGAMLALGWSQRRWREYGRSREKRRAIRLATLMQHADPVTARVDVNEQRIEGLEADLRTTKMTYDGVIGALGGYLAEHGFPVAEDLQKTMEMPVRPHLVARDGKLLSDENRDSA